jgi:hypothetical protein
MSHTKLFEEDARDDDTIVRVASASLVEAIHRPKSEVEETVRDELTKRRLSARVQTFVPIFAERAARERLAG